MGSQQACGMQADVEKQYLMNSLPWASWSSKRKSQGHGVSHLVTVDVLYVEI